VAAVEILYFTDGQKAQAERIERAKAAAVAGGYLAPAKAWPEFFGTPDTGAFPSSGADMTDFEWETPTPQSFEADLDAVLAASERVVLSEPSHPDSPPPATPLPSPDRAALEWG